MWSIHCVLLVMSSFRGVELSFHLRHVTLTLSTTLPAALTPPSPNGNPQVRSVIDDFFAREVACVRASAGNPNTTTKSNPKGPEETFKTLLILTLTPNI